MNSFELLFASFSRCLKNIFLTLLLLALITITFSAVVVCLGTFDLSIPSDGMLRTTGVEAYWDFELTNRTQRIDWGALYFGSTKNVTFYLRSVSNIEVFLQLFESNVSPPGMSQYLNLSWDYNDEPIASTDPIQITLFLSTSSSENFIEYIDDYDVKSFTLNINIVAKAV